MTRSERLAWGLALTWWAGCSRPPVPVSVPVPDAGRAPPIARRAPITTTLHGDTRTDEYGWMQHKGPEVEALLAAENAYTDEQLAPLQPLRDALVSEFSARRPRRVDSLGTRHGAYDYFTRSDLSLPFAQYYRRPLDGGAPELVLDLNTVAPDASYVDLLDLDVSDDGQRFAWAVDVTGAREFVLRVRELDGGVDGPPLATHVTSFTFAADSRTLFFTTENESKRSQWLTRLDPGADAGVPVYDERDEHYELTVDRSNARGMVLLESASLATTEVRVLDARAPKGTFTVALPRVEGQRGAVEEHGAALVLLTEDRGAEGRVVTVPRKNPAGRRTELVPRREGVPIEAIDVLAGHLVVWERIDGQPRPRALDWKTHASVPFGPPAAHLAPASQTSFETTRYRYSVESPVQPMTVVERDLLSGEERELWREPVLGFDPSSAEVLRVFATAADGTKIPITLARKKGTPADAPLLLEAYGAYGSVLDPEFLSTSVSLLERGVVLGFAHVRGGGEFGDAWHEAGKLANKRNTFSDFIACAEFLIAERHTSPGKLIITGASAGGLLMGGVVNQRPALFHAALVEVPFVDVLTTMLDPSLPLTVGEFEEWGDPREAEQYRWMREYSPYDNVTAQPYPALLVRSAYNDQQVLFHEPAKWVQRLRATKTDPKPLLLWMNMDPAGHSGRTRTDDVLKDEATRLAWLLSQWGLGIKVAP